MMSILPDNVITEIENVANISISRFYLCNDENEYWLTISMPNCSVNSDAVYRATCDEIESSIQSLLPDGWQFHWAGSGNTDAGGDCTEDAYISAMPK